MNFNQSELKLCMSPDTGRAYFAFHDEHEKEVFDMIDIDCKDTFEETFDMKSESDFSEFHSMSSSKIETDIKDEYSFEETLNMIDSLNENEILNIMETYSGECVNIQYENVNVQPGNENENVNVQLGNENVNVQPENENVNMQPENVNVQPENEILNMLEIYSQENFDTLYENENENEILELMEIYFHENIDVSENQNQNEDSLLIGGALEIEEDGYIIAEGAPLFDMRLGRRHQFFGVGVEEFFHVNFTDRWQRMLIKDILKDLHHVFQHLLDILNQEFNPQDRIRIHINHNDLVHSIRVPLQELSELTPEYILERIEEVLQSHQNLSVNDEFEIGVGVINIPFGQGRTKLTNVKQDSHRKTSIIEILNKGNICLPMSILMANMKLKLKEELITKTEYVSYIRKDHRRKVEKEARILLEELKISSLRPGNLNDIPLYEEKFNVQIIVYSNTNEPGIPKRTGTHKTRKMFLWHTQYEEEGKKRCHFEPIISITGFLTSRYFCNHCYKGHNREYHKCKSTCPQCRTSTCTSGTPVICFKCNLEMKSESCFINHKNICNTRWKCPVCTQVLNVKKRKPEDHICGEYNCNSCGKWVMKNHQCNLRRLKSKDEVKKFIFYDFECTVENTIHIPVLVIAQTSCKHCQHKDVTENSKCSYCGTKCNRCSTKKPSETNFCENCIYNREVIFQGENTLDDFGEWLFARQNAGARVIAHNSKGYDGYFLLDYLLRNNIETKPLYRGTKLMNIHVGSFLNMDLIDSVNFLPMKLKAFSKAFEISTTKGDFPFKFIKKENWNYVGSYPDLDMYGVDTMQAKDREVFIQWYEEKKNDVFDFQKELIQYCRADVSLLRQGCLKFRDHIMKITDGLDPFTNITIASTCMSIYREKLMPLEYEIDIDDDETVTAILLKDTFVTKTNDEWKEIPKNQIKSANCVRGFIANVDSNGHVKDNYSIDCIQWLHVVMENGKLNDIPCYIQHALNGGEYRIPGTHYKADGYDALHNTIYEYHGCFYHACPSCYPNRKTKHPITNKSMEEVYNETLKKERILRERGYNYVEMWEHSFKEIKKDPEISNFLNNLDIQTPLVPSDSFFGGRTNAIKLYHLAQEDETLDYYDFTSLYPWCLKYGCFPIGHPKVITSNFKDIKHYFGMVKVKILPPKRLYHPVLPYRCNGKLTFPLCASCVKNKSHPCKCSDEKRAWTGTYCTPEILKALEKGYVILEIYSVFHWEESLDYKRDGIGLFNDYVDMFLKIKQEASGWPDWIQTEEDKEYYIANYMLHENIKLNPENIHYNNALRSVAKLCLNSFWGKWGEKNNHTQSVFVRSETEFLNIVTDVKKDVKDFHIIRDDDVALIEWEYKDGFLPENLKRNIYIASFVTCYARLHLYDVLDLLQERVCYMDTDSIIFVSKPNEPKPSLGDYLGELTSEIPSDQNMIEFLAAGPKNYAYRLSDGSECVKVRGFSLNYKNSKVINLDVVKDLILHKGNGVDIVNENKISRKKYDVQIYNRVETKHYEMVYDKRYIDPVTLYTYPFGY